MCPKLLILVLSSELLVADSLPWPLQLPVIMTQTNEYSFDPQHTPKSDSPLVSRNSILRTYCVPMPVKRAVEEEGSDYWVPALYQFTIWREKFTGRRAKAGLKMCSHS